MKTIAITMDEATIDRIDQLVSSGDPSAPSRSGLIREAVQDYLSQMEDRREHEREKAVYHKHRARIARQAAALVQEQAEP